MTGHFITSPALAFLLDWAVRGAVLAVIAGLVVAVARLHNVRTRLALWTSVLCACLALPLLRPIVPQTVLPRVVHRASAVVPPASRIIFRTIARPEAILASGSPAKPVVHRDWGLAMLGVWAAGVLLLIARLITGLHLARRVVASARPVEDQIRLMRGLRILESDSLSVPVTVGVFRPVVLIPADWRAWPNEQLRAVLAHERSHAERRDGLVRVIARAYRALLWFSPISWWLDRHLADLAERASDDAAMAETPDRAAYAEVVLGFFKAPARTMLIEGHAMASGGSAERRIDRILAAHPLSLRLNRAALAFVIVLTLSAAVLVASGRAAAQSPPPPPPALPAEPADPAVAPDPPPPPPAAFAPVAVPAPPQHLPDPPSAPDVEPPLPPAPPPPYSEDSAWVLFHNGTSCIFGGAEDMRRAQEAYRRLGEDLIWLRRDGRAWTIRDAEVLKQMNEMLRPFARQRQEELAKLQAELVKHQAEFSSSEVAARERVLRMSAELMEKKMAEQQVLIQEALKKMHVPLAQAEQALATRQAEISRAMAEIGQTQERMNTDRLQKLLDEAIESGKAVPADK